LLAAGVRGNLAHPLPRHDGIVFGYSLFGYSLFSYGLFSYGV
jgi:hypothetical protein